MITNITAKKFISIVAVTIPLFVVATYSVAHAARMDFAGYGGGVYMQTFRTTLNGQQEVPSNSSKITGTATFDVRSDTNGIDYRIRIMQPEGTSFEGAQLQCASSGANGPVAFTVFRDTTKITNLYKGRLVSGTLTNANILHGAAKCDPNIQSINGLVTAMQDGKIYLNVLSSDKKTGLIRGQVMAVTPGDKSAAGLSKITYYPIISPSTKIVSMNTILQFNGKDFAPNETVTISKSYGGVTTAFTTALVGPDGTFTKSIDIGSKRGTTKYTFTGQKSGGSATASIIAR